MRIPALPTVSKQLEAEVEDNLRSNVFKKITLYVTSSFDFLIGLYRFHRVHTAICKAYAGSQDSIHELTIERQVSKIMEIVSPQAVDLEKYGNVSDPEIDAEPFPV